MTIFFGADHRGFELKNKLIEYLQDKNIRVQDLGNYEYDSQDDNPDFAKKVATAIQQNLEEFIGIVICGSGVGVCITANRFTNNRAVLGLHQEQVQHARENDHTNILALPAEYIDFEKAKQLVDTCVNSHPKLEEKYLRRVKKMDELQK